MNIQKIQDVDVISCRQCRNVVYTNLGAADSHEVLLPGLKESILGPICFLGAAPHEVTFCAVETGALIGVGGPATRVSIPAEHCAGSTTTLVKMFGGAWHVSSNVPLVFE